MGIEYKAAIIVGLPRHEFEDQDQLNEWIDNEEVEVCSPYYDGSDADWAIAGFFVATSELYSPSLFSWDAERVGELAAQFKDLTGKDGKVWLSPYGY